MERLTTKFKLTAVASALAATLAACGGGSDSTSTPAASGSTQPTALNTTPRALNLNVGSQASVSVSQAGYTGAIAADLSSCGNKVQQSQTSTGVFVISAVQAGTCTATFTTTTNASAQLAITIAADPVYLDSPMGIAFKNGKLYVASNGNNQVLVYDEAIAADGSVSLTPDSAGSVQTNVNGPTAVALDAAGDLYVANLNGTSSLGSITVYDPTLTPVNGATITRDVGYPLGVAVDQTGTVFVANGNINVYAPSDSTLSDGFVQVTPATPANGYAVDYFGGALATGSSTAVTLTTDEGTYAGPKINFAAVRYAGTATGTATAVAYFGSSGLVQPQLYVADPANDSVDIFPLSATTATAPTASITAAQGLENPYGVAVDDAGNVIVSNQGASSLQVFDPTGAKLLLTVK